jgi:hypothetical protein
MTVCHVIAPFPLKRSLSWYMYMNATGSISQPIIYGTFKLLVSIYIVEEFKLSQYSGREF